MTTATRTVEKVLLEIFERKNWIVEQVKQQTDLYNQHLASKLLIHGIVPPSWLWNPPNHPPSSSSHPPKELNKEDLISELLLPRPQHTARYSSAHYSLFNRPAVTGDNGDLPDGYLIETHASSKGTDAGEGPSTLVESYDNNAGPLPNSVPELDVSVTSPQDEMEASVQKIYSAPDQSLARIQRSKSRQKALQLRNSAKAQSKTCFGDENNARVPACEITLVFDPEQASHANELLKSAEPCVIGNRSCRATELSKASDCQDKEKQATTFTGGSTRSISSSKQVTCGENVLEVDNFIDNDEKNNGNAVTSAIDSLYRQEDGKGSEEVANSSAGCVRTRSQSGATVNSVDKCNDPKYISDDQEILPCPDERDSVGKQEYIETILANELASDDVVKDTPFSSRSKHEDDNIRFRNGLEILGARPPSDCFMFVKPKQLDFGDMEQSNLNEALSLSCREKRLDKSPNLCHTLSETASSPLKVTFTDHNSLSSDKQAASDKEVSSRSEEDQRLSTGSAFQGSVGVQIKNSNSLMNNSLLSGTNVDTLKAVLDLRNSPLVHAPDGLLPITVESLNAHEQVSPGKEVSSRSEEDQGHFAGSAFQGSAGVQVKNSGSVMQKQPPLKTNEDNLEAGSPLQDDPPFHEAECTLHNAVESSDAEIHQVELCNGEQFELMPFIDVEQTGLEPQQNSERGPRFHKREHSMPTGFSNLDNEKSRESHNSLIDQVGTKDAGCSGLDAARISHLEENTLLAHGSRRPSWSGNDTFDFFTNSPVRRRQYNTVVVNSWPQVKRRKFEDQQVGSATASRRFRVEKFENKKIDAANTNLENAEDNPNLVMKHSSFSNKNNVLEVHKKTKYPPTESKETPPETFREKGSLHPERQNKHAKNRIVMTSEELGVSPMSSLAKGSSGDFQECLDAMEETDTRNTNSEVPNRCAGQDNQPLLHLDCGESNLLATKSHLSEDNLVVPRCTDRSPADKDLDLVGDQMMPVLEGFIIDSQIGEAETNFVGDGMNFDLLELPNSAIERASILEKICKSASMLTPISSFSSSFKLQKSKILHQSVPNCLLESKDIQNTLSSNDDVHKQFKDIRICVDEINGSDEGLSHSHFSSYSDAYPTCNASNLCASPVQSLWERISSHSGSSEKKLSSNPELTCFPIEEDPSISEECDISDEASDKEDVSTSVVDCSRKHEPLADITEACSNRPALVSAEEKVFGRGSMDSVNTEASFTLTHNKIRQRIGNSHRNKSQVQDNKASSIGTNGIKRTKESLNTRFSKQNSLDNRKEGSKLVDQESKRNNIVTGVTSFIPLVQQKQVNAMCTGKREIKVKALGAAEAARRLEEKKENERKMRKEAMKLERAKMEQENLRQMELNKKKKEEERKKKEADMAARKRMREEEERKEKERKKKKTEEARRQNNKQNEKPRPEKVGKGKQCLAVDDRTESKMMPNDDIMKHHSFGKEKDDITLEKPEMEPRQVGNLPNDVQQANISPEDCGSSGDLFKNGEVICTTDKLSKNENLIAKISEEKSYEISPYQCSDDEDEEEEDLPSRKFIPSWASRNRVTEVLHLQQDIDPHVLFPAESFCSIDEVLLPRNVRHKELDR